ALRSRTIASFHSFPPGARHSMLILRGAPALSPFRAEKLAARLSAIHPDIRLLDSQFVHFADLSAPIAPDQEDRLHQLLGAAPPGTAAQSPDSAADAGSCLLLVVPRPGTISPWASKATDVAHNCGLAAVHRL